MGANATVTILSSQFPCQNDCRRAAQRGEQIGGGATRRLRYGLRWMWFWAPIEKLGSAANPSAMQREQGEGCSDGSNVFSANFTRHRLEMRGLPLPLTHPSTPSSAIGGIILSATRRPHRRHWKERPHGLVRLMEALRRGVGGKAADAMAPKKPAINPRKPAAAQKQC